MEFRCFGKADAPVVMLIPGLGVSWEIFKPLIELLGERCHIVAVEVDGFILGRHTSFTSIDDQAIQLANHINNHLGGRVECIYGLSLGGKIPQPYRQSLQTSFDKGGLWIVLLKVCSNLLVRTPFSYFGKNR